MTKYRLKDQELQKKLDEISNGDFSRQIEGNLQNIKGRGTTDADYRLFFGELPVNRFSMLLYEHEIEIFEEYDPNDWNSFPEVMPPEDVLMRVETVGGDKFRGYFHTFPDGVGRWCCVCFTPRHMPLHETEKVRRYRPCE